MPGHCADLVPDHNTWDKFLAHLFWSPVLFTTHWWVGVNMRDLSPRSIALVVYPASMVMECALCKWTIIMLPGWLDHQFRLFVVLQLGIILGSIVRQVQPLSPVMPLGQSYILLTCFLPLTYKIVRYASTPSLCRSLFWMYKMSASPEIPALFNVSQVSVSTFLRTLGYYANLDCGF